MTGSPIGELPDPDRPDASQPIRVAVIDDHPVVREGTAALLDARDDLTVVGQGATVEDARQLGLRGDVDVMILDVRLGADSGLQLLAELHRASGPAVVILSSFDYPQYVDAALRHGASGYILKTAPIDELVDAVRRAADGGMSFARRPRAGATRLPTARELDVIRLVVDGRSNDEIALALGIGSKTVETHLHRLYERFAVASRTELATRALREGWMEVPPGELSG
ncbi:MAG TPA: response regulator transcription factor [Candidatus Limnocylindrales bacterium]|nr:response regulator transcription factor [Candidatus Limnocylindrales bacterium]